MVRLYRISERNLNEAQWEDRKQWSLGVGQRRKTFSNIYILTTYTPNITILFFFVEMSHNFRVYMNPWSRTAALRIVSLVCCVDTAACCSRHIIAWPEATQHVIKNTQNVRNLPDAFRSFHYLSFNYYLCGTLSSLTCLCLFPVVLIYWNFQYFGLVLSSICWKAIDRK